MNKNSNVVRAASWLSVQRNMPHLVLHSDVLVLIIDFIRVIGKSAIEEIDGDMYNIEEYDGKETVVTPKDICWTVISYKYEYKD